MATKSYRAKLLDMSDRVLKESIERTHLVYNECLSQIMQLYLKMRKGRFGPECQELSRLMLDGGGTVHDFMNPLTTPNPRQSSAKKEGMDYVFAYQAKKGPLFNRHKGFANVGGRLVWAKGQGENGIPPDSPSVCVNAKFWMWVCNNAISALRSNWQLMADWRKGRLKWLEEKETWEKENESFMTFWNGPYQEFIKYQDKLREQFQEQAGQKPTKRKKIKSSLGKRFSRWQCWYEWIIQHPEIIEWRGKASKGDFRLVPAEELEKLSKRTKRQDKLTSKLLNWLEDNNPELKALMACRKKYIREYVRFGRPPTLTMPSVKSHPLYMSLEREEFYKNADFEKGIVDLQLIAEDEEGNWAFQWFEEVRLAVDPRLVPSYRKQIFSSEGKLPPYIEGRPGRTLNFPAEKASERQAGVTGARLLPKGKASFLTFTVIEQNEPLKIKPQKYKNAKCRADYFVSGGGDRIPIRALCIDLGIRHLGGYGICQANCTGNGWELNWEKKGIVKTPMIPSLRQIVSHDRQLRVGRKKRGKAISSERSNIELQDHRTHMADDRFKKAANIIVELARKHDVHIILFEQLETLLTSAFDERWANSQLRNMNRRKIVEMVTQQAGEFGVFTDELNPYLTSHICSQCKRPGLRFSIKKKNPWKEKNMRSECQDYGYPEWDQGGHLFRCPHCEYKINADVNAACNLAIKFFGHWKDWKRKNWLYTLKGSKDTFDAKTEFRLWSDSSIQRKQLKDSPF